MPSGKDGFLFNVGKPIDENLLTRAVAMHGAAVNTGDQVQITKLDFRGRSIAVDVNGGGKPKKIGAIMFRSAWVEPCRR